MSYSSHAVQQLLIDYVMVFQLSWDAVRMSSSVPTGPVSHRDSDAMDRRTVRIFLISNNVVSICVRQIQHYQGQGVKNFTSVTRWVVHAR